MVLHLLNRKTTNTYVLKSHAQTCLHRFARAAACEMPCNGGDPYLVLGQRKVEFINELVVAVDPHGFRTLVNTHRAWITDLPWALAREIE